MNLNRLAITAALLVAVVASVCATVYVKNFPDNFVPVSVTALDESPASIVLRAPDKAKVGQLVILDVSESTANSFRWEPQQKTANFLVIDDGRRAVFSAEVGGEYTFVVAAAKDNTVDVKIHTIKVAGGPAEPGDDIAARIASWCEPISSATKRDDAIKLAQSFSSVSAVISDQMTPADIVEATKKSNRDALGDNVQNWVPFLEGLQKELKAQAEAGKLPDNEAHRRMWRAIADGLKEYAETL
jgi:hypothetical protein